MYCEQCGAPIPEGARFCEQCGAPVPFPPEEQPKPKPEPVPEPQPEPQPKPKPVPVPEQPSLPRRGERRPRRFSPLRLIVGTVILAGLLYAAYWVVVYL